MKTYGHTDIITRAVLANMTASETSKCRYKSIRKAKKCKMSNVAIMTKLT